MYAPRVSIGLIRTTRLVCSTSVLALMLGLLAAAPAALGADPSVTIKYDGTLTEKYVAKVSDPSDFTEELTLKWEETATDDARTNEPIAPPSFTISGSIHLSSEHQPPNASCTGTLSARGGPYGNSPAGFLGGGLVSVSAVLPNSGKYVQSSGIEHCALAANAGLSVGGPGVPAPEFVAASAPTESFPEHQSLYTHPFTVPETVNREKAPNGTEESESTLSLSATLTATTSVDTGPQGFHPSGPPGHGGSGSSPHKPLPLGRRARRAKEQARRDLPEALKEAWAAHGLQALTAISGAPLLQVADELGQKAGPLAGNDALTRVLDDVRIYDDPPLADVGKLAQPVAAKTPALPPCAQPEAPELTYCNELRSAYAGLLVADNEVAADDTALERTVSRASAAASARNARALAVQEAHAAELGTALSTALAGKRHAAEPVRTLLLEARPDWSLSVKQASAAISWLKRRLSHSGIHASALTRLAGSALRPGKTDVLVRL
jgi:hypothetical protein